MRARAVKVQACPQRDQRPGIRSRLSGQKESTGGTDNSELRASGPNRWISQSVLYDWYIEDRDMC